MRKVPGRVIRVSDETFDFLERRRVGFESWDILFRTMFGIPLKRKQRNGGRAPKRLTQVWVVPGAPWAFETEALARGYAVKLAVIERSDTIKQPILMREVL